MRAGLVFSLVFLSQSCSVFFSCDISTGTVLIRGSRELSCCFVVLAICVRTAKNVSDHLHALHYHLILTRGSGAALGVVQMSAFGEGSQGGEETAATAHLEIVGKTEVA